MQIREFQRMIDEVFGAKDRARGIDGTYRWFSEEVGELARAIRKQDRDNLEEEFADVLAWLATMASICEVDLEAAAAKKYPGCCLRCGESPCGCKEST
ncbi:MAG: nucleotide pyrophosphohydrolase [Planctomycetes bacterium]|nr:nucleotide pyrophosphohydrolase [Planctomycetota bacterium]